MRRAAACLAAVLLLAACSGGDDEKPQSSPTGLLAGPVVPVVTATAKPKVTVPTGPPPAALVKTDLIVGAGDFALPGQTVTVQYVGLHYDTGEQFDASWDSGHPFTFKLGNEDVIAGWDEGVVGMRVGGRRELVIPPDLAYGDSGQGDIAPGETLVFVVDLISVSGRAGVGGG